MADQPVSVRDWTDVVRRARLGRTTKAVALLLATYADYQDGTRVRPGLARLAVDCELRYNTVQDCVAELRKAGLIKLVRRAARRGDTDEYRLALAEDLLDNIEVLSPAAVKLEAERLLTAKRGRHRKPEADLHPGTRGADDPQPADLHPAAQGADGAPAPRDAGCGTSEPAEPAPRFTGSETGPAPRFTPHLHPAQRATNTHERDTKTNIQPSTDLDLTVTVSHATRPYQDPISTPLPTRCPHGLRVRRRPDGNTSCALCRIAEHLPAVRTATA